jgi:hypothetical protein
MIFQFHNTDQQQEGEDNLERSLVDDWNKKRHTNAANVSSPPAQEAVATIKSKQRETCSSSISTQEEQEDQPHLNDASSQDIILSPSRAEQHQEQPIIDDGNQQSTPSDLSVEANNDPAIMDDSRYLSPSPQMAQNTFSDQAQPTSRHAGIIQRRTASHCQLMPLIGSRLEALPSSECQAGVVTLEGRKGNARYRAIAGLIEHLQHLDSQRLLQERQFSDLFYESSRRFLVKGS